MAAYDNNSMAQVDAVLERRRQELHAIRSKHGFHTPQPPRDNSPLRRGIQTERPVRPYGGLHGNNGNARKVELQLKALTAWNPEIAPLGNNHDENTNSNVHPEMESSWDQDEDALCFESTMDEAFEMEKNQNNNVARNLETEWGNEKENGLKNSENQLEHMHEEAHVAYSNSNEKVMEELKRMNEKVVCYEERCLSYEMKMEEWNDKKMTSENALMAKMYTLEKKMSSHKTSSPSTQNTSENVTRLKAIETLIARQDDMIQTLKAEKIEMNANMENRIMDALMKTVSQNIMSHMTKMEMKLNEHTLHYANVAQKTASDNTLLVELTTKLNLQVKLYLLTDIYNNLTNACLGPKNTRHARTAAATDTQKNSLLLTSRWLLHYLHDLVFMDFR